MKGIELRAIQGNRQSFQWKICMGIGHSSEFVRLFLFASKSSLWVQTVAQWQ